VLGIDGHIIEMQARAIDVLASPKTFNFTGKGGRTVHITGMAGGAIQEALDRIEGAFVKLKIPPSPVKIVINLAPAGLYKKGTWLDLPLAVLLLMTSGYLPELPKSWCDEHVLFGEIGLHGEIRKVSGTLAIAFAAADNAIQKIIVPSGNEKEGWLVYKPVQRVRYAVRTESCRTVLWQDRTWWCWTIRRQMRRRSRKHKSKACAKSSISRSRDL